MGMLILSCIAGVAGVYLALRTIDSHRIWEVTLAVVVGLVFGFSVVYLSFSAFGNLLVVNSQYSEVEVQETLISHVEVERPTNDTPTLYENDDGLTEVHFTGEATAVRFTIVSSGERHTVPANNVTILVRKDYSDTLVRRVQYFPEGTFQHFMFGANFKTLDRVFFLEEGKDNARRLGIEES